MSGGDFSDWEDPFADDQADAARRRRRDEREARRRGVREGLGERVAAAHESGGEQAAGAQPEEPAAVPPPRTRRRLSERSATVSPRDLLIRRIVGLALVAAALVIAVVGGKALFDAVGGDDKPQSFAPALKVENLTVPEGLDRRQIAEVAAEAGLRGDYVKAAKQAPKGFPVDKYSPDESPPHLEGFLFPATYELEKDTSVKDLVARQLEAFEQNIRGVDLSYAESKNLNVYDVLKIASMIEREIQVPGERKLAAAVIYNRLSAGDTLGIDATIRYEDQNYDEQLTQSRLEQDTPYNTRVNPGLPPTPIGNPGLAAIKAAANPAKSDAYYFVVKPDTCGEHVFVETEEEFLAAEAKYQEALQAEGGSPTDC